MKRGFSLALFVAVLAVVFLMEGGADAARRDEAYVLPSVPEALVEGMENTYVGLNAGTANGGLYNTFIGARAGTANDAGSSNTFVGREAGLANTSGALNTFTGTNAGHANTVGVNNTFNGYQAGYSTTFGVGNTFMGTYAGQNHTSGSANIFIGESAGYTNSAGSTNTLVGYHAGYSGNSDQNTFNGAFSGEDNTNGGANTLMGYGSGRNITAGAGNTFIGTEAGLTNTTGINNVFIGRSAGWFETGSNKLYIANSVDSTPLIHGDFTSGSETLTVNGNLTAIGPDSGLVRLANTTAAATDKASRMVLLDYNTATPNYLFGAFTDSANNFVAFGGGAPVANAATQVDIFTAPVKGTPGGTPRLTVLGNGFVGIGTQAPTHLVQLSGGAFSDGAAWSNASSRALKGNFNAIDPKAILDKVGALPIQSWTYNSEADSARHLGPTAEDFFAAFGLGSDDKAIGTVDADGVALAAIQGLIDDGRDKDRELADYKSRLASLEERFAALEQLLTAR